MTRYTPSEFRPATRYGRDEPARGSDRLRVIRDGVVGFIAVFTVLVLLLVAAGGTT